MTLLRRMKPEDVPAARVALPDAETRREAGRIVEDVRARGETALLEHAFRLGDIGPQDRLVWDKPALAGALGQLPAAERAVLERTADRIRTFAEAQRAALADVAVPVPGGRAGHTVAPVDRAGCYAPGGRFPLPSSVLMTAVTARAAGVPSVWVASPKPALATLAAAAVAGADGLLAAGGPHAIAALAFGAGAVPRCDLIAGPGNRWVTAAKQIVGGRVGVDMVAGPSELLVLADDTADADTVAADLLAQAEHDPDAVPLLVTTSERLVEEVDAAIARRQATLGTAATAREALQRNGGAVVVGSLEEGADVCNRLAPEHLQVMTADPREAAGLLRHYGALFLGRHAAEVLGDYGAGPNHVLPTGGAARFSGGLSVFTFLRVRTWLEIDDACAAQAMVEDAVALGRMEGLEGHAAAARCRLEGRG